MPLRIRIVNLPLSRQEEISDQEVRNAIEAALSEWERAGGVLFREVGAEEEADIQIEWIAVEHPNLTGTTVGVAESPPDCVPPEERQLPRLILLDDFEEQWTTVASSVLAVNIQAVLMHEIGHALGFNHSTAAGSIMQEDLRSISPVLSPDDQALLRQKYGPPITGGAPGGGNHPTAPTPPPP